MLVAWDNKTMLDHKSIKGLIAELVACVGPEVAKEVIVDLSDP
jgi:arginine-tRNA-protein transferase